MEKMLAAVTAGLMLVAGAVPAVRYGEPATSLVQQAEPERIQTITGTIMHDGNEFVLNDPVNKTVYRIDDGDKAKEYLGKRVRVTGTVDAVTKILHVETIQVVV